MYDGPFFVCVGNPRAGAPPTGGDHAAVLPGGEDPSGVAQPGEQDAQVRGQRVEREREHQQLGHFTCFCTVNSIYLIYSRSKIF